MPFALIAGVAEGPHILDGCHPSILKGDDVSRVHLGDGGIMSIADFTYMTATELALLSIPLQDEGSELWALPVRFPASNWHPSPPV